jgi:phosphate transport system substrate-binding protein
VKVRLGMGGLATAVAVAALVASGCGGGEVAESQVTADGSSTVGPFTSEAARQFNERHEDVSIDVDISRTGAGLDRFCAGETDLSNASRPIDQDEAEACAEAGIDYVELQVANDAITVAIHTPILYDWVTCLSVTQLRRIWEPESKVSNWNEVDPSFPDVPLRLYGAGTGSGTFDYFTFVINGERGASRTDYAATDDDNDTVEGVADDKGALGYFGFSYYQEHKELFTALEIDGGNGCVPPSVETVQNGTYKPLSRPLFVYVNGSSLEEKPAVREFVRFMLENERRIAAAARFVPLSKAQLGQQLRKLDRAVGE